MPMVERIVASPRNVAGLILAVSAGVLAAALLSQYVGGLVPCVLCYYQRLPYAMTIVLAGLTLGFAGAMGPREAAGTVALCGLVFLAGAGVAGFHVGVEQHWWQGTEGCGTTIDPNLSLQALKAALLAQPVVRCDEVPWSLFGMSMAGFNFLASLAFAGTSLWAARRIAGGAP